MYGTGFFEIFMMLAVLFFTFFMFLPSQYGKRHSKLSGPLEDKNHGAWDRSRKKLSAHEALQWHNIEQRRVACEMIGWDAVMKELKPKIINRNKDPQIGELLSVELPDIGTALFLRVKCGTGRDFVIPVPREMKTAQEANAWTWGLKPNQYNPEVRT